MSLLEEYMANIKPRIEATVHETLATTIKDGLCDAIKESAQKRVYDAYTPSEEHLLERRYELGDRENLLIFVSENTIEIKNVETLRHDPSQGEAVVIEEGMTHWHQPDHERYNREFMEPALQDYMVFAESALFRALSAAGFDVQYTYDPYTAREDELPF